MNKSKIIVQVALWLVPILAVVKATGPFVYWYFLCNCYFAALNILLLSLIFFYLMILYIYRKSTITKDTRAIIKLAKVDMEQLFYCAYLCFIAIMSYECQWKTLSYVAMGITIFFLGILLANNYMSNLLSKESYDRITHK